MPAAPPRARKGPPAEGSSPGGRLRSWRPVEDGAATAGCPQRSSAGCLPLEHLPGANVAARLSYMAAPLKTGRRIFVVHCGHGTRISAPERPQHGRYLRGPARTAANTVMGDQKQPYNRAGPHRRASHRTPMARVAMRQASPPCWRVLLDHCGSANGAFALVWDEARVRIVRLRPRRAGDQQRGKRRGDETQRPALPSDGTAHMSLLEVA